MSVFFKKVLNTCILRDGLRACAEPFSNLLIWNTQLTKKLILIILILLAAGCNVPETPPTATITSEATETPIPPTSTPEPTATATETPLPAYLEVEPGELEGTELTIRFVMDEKVRAELTALTERYNEENPDGIILHAEPAHSADELEEALFESDLIIADSSWLRGIQAENNAFLELSGFLNDPTLNLSGEDITPLMLVMLETENLDGNYFALPLWAEPGFLFYNKTWAIELGYENTPTDLAGFAEQACAAGRANYTEKDDGKHGTGGWIVSSDPEDVMSWLLVFAKNGETPGSLISDEASDVFEDAAAWLRNLYDNGCAWNSRLTEPYDYFANRYALFYSGTYSDAKRQYSAFEQSEDHAMDNWDLILYPTRQTGSDENPRIFAETVSIALIDGTDPKQTSAAWQFIRWLYSDENAAALALAAGGWPVQDSDKITKLYRGSGEDKLYQTLSYRQYLVNSDADGNWITDQRIFSDGFAYVFNPSAKPEDIPAIREQIGSLIAEIHSVNRLSENLMSESVTSSGGNDETLP